ncbi:MAG: iron reductase [Gammaproteobacteria bacterium]|nr:iron reductase [Gammaproteobacteria bacterium]
MLAIPAYPLLLEMIYDDQHYPELMHTTGTFSAHLLVITLAITPLRFLTKNWPAASSTIVWLVRRRRYFGVTSFIYAALHTLLYLHDTWDFNEVLIHSLRPEMAVGWIGFLILIPLALTSNNAAVHKMGRSWKTLQRFSYLAAICVFLHWVLFDFLLAEVLFWFLSLTGLQLYRIGRRYIFVREKPC